MSDYWRPRRFRLFRSFCLLLRKQSILVGAGGKKSGWRLNNLRFRERFFFTGAKLWNPRRIDTPRETDSCCSVRADQPVIRTGPYRVVRHPSYTAGIMMYIGIGLALGNWVSLVLLTISTVVAYCCRVVSRGAGACPHNWRAILSVHERAKALHSVHCVGMSGHGGDLSLTPR